MSDTSKSRAISKEGNLLQSFSKYRSQALFFILSGMILPGIIGVMGSRLAKRDEAAHLDRIEENIYRRLGSLQTAMYDLKWDLYVDCSDDSKHINSRGYDELQLLTDTLAGYVYPDGHNTLEGTAVLTSDGKLRTKLVGDIDEEGSKLEAAKYASVIEGKPWLKDPWMADYSLINDWFKANPDADFFVSSIVGLKGRDVVLVAYRTSDELSVICQYDIDTAYRDLIGVGVDEGESFLISDFAGSVNASAGSLSRRIVSRLESSGSLDRIKASGAAASEQGEFGATGLECVTIDNTAYTLYYNTVEDQFIVGVVQDDEAMREEIALLSRDHIILTYLAMGVMFATSVGYILKTAREHGQIVEGREKVAELEAYRRSIGTVSHYLNNPLTSVKFNIELLKEAKTISDRDGILLELENAYASMQHNIKLMERMSEKGIVKYSGQAGVNTIYDLETDSERA